MNFRKWCYEIQLTINEMKFLITDDIEIEYWISILKWNSNDDIDLLFGYIDTWLLWTIKRLSFDNQPEV